jgi:DNA polymerase III epsilon subunit family exonuclease
MKQPPDNPPAFRYSTDLPRLKARAFEAIREAGEEGADAVQIAGPCIGSEKVPDGVARRMVEALLEGDRRVEKKGDGRYVLRDFRADWGGTPLLDARFCVVDVETTGVTGDSRIIEVGAVRVEGLRLGEEFQSLVGVDVPIPPQIENLTGITAEMLASALGPETVLDSFCDFLGDDVFCAHNAPFDRRFVFREVEHFCLRTLKNPVLCTRLVSRRALPGEKSYSLDALAERWSVVNEMRHRALGDARAAAEILVGGVERLMEKGISTLEDLLRVQHKAAFTKFTKKKE